VPRRCKRRKIACLHLENIKWDIKPLGDRQNPIPIKQAKKAD